MTTTHRPEWAPKLLPWQKEILNSPDKIVVAMPRHHGQAMSKYWTTLCRCIESAIKGERVAFLTQRTPREVARNIAALGCVVSVKQKRLVCKAGREAFRLTVLNIKSK